MFKCSKFSEEVITDQIHDFKPSLMLDGLEIISLCGNINFFFLAVPNLCRAHSVGEAGPQRDIAAGRLYGSGHQVSPGHGDERQRAEVHG